MRWEIILAPQAVNDLRRLSARDRYCGLIRPRSLLIRLRLTFCGSYLRCLSSASFTVARLRIDEIRVFYDLSEARVEVLAIVAKSSAAEWLAEGGVGE